jgi:Fur family transcriptional regulator, iron response regulator
MPFPQSTTVQAPAAKNESPMPFGSELNGCPWHDIKERLRDVGLRPTRQRISLGWLLFGKGDRHVTAEMLYDEANQARLQLSLATVYNTLNQFTDAGLLRRVAVDASKTFYDTNKSAHHHFLVEGNLVDIVSDHPLVSGVPSPPSGYEIDHVDVIVRLRRKS